MTLKLIIQVTHIRRAASMCVTLSRGGWLSDDTHDYDDTTDQWSWPFRLQTFACRGSQSSQWQWWLAHSGWLYRDKFNQSNGWRLDGDDDDDEVDFDDDDDDDYDHNDDDHLGSSSREASLAVALSVVTPCSCEERRGDLMICVRRRLWGCWWWSRWSQQIYSWNLLDENLRRSQEGVWIFLPSLYWPFPNKEASPPLAMDKPLFPLNWTHPPHLNLPPSSL